MLEQHPVPQNVTTFQFRLIGDMTIKQFGYLAGGAILAYISYNLPLPFFFRYPLTAIFGLGGIGFAFVPIEERPMDVWFLSFIRSIYSPTQYLWQREAPLRPVTTSLPQPLTSTQKTSTSPSLAALFDFSFLTKPQPKREIPQQPAPTAAVNTAKTPQAPPVPLLPQANTTPSVPLAKTPVPAASHLPPSQIKPIPKVSWLGSLFAPTTPKPKPTIKPPPPPETDTGRVWKAVPAIAQPYPSIMASAPIPAIVGKHLDLTSQQPESSKQAPQTTSASRVDNAQIEAMEKRLKEMEALLQNEQGSKEHLSQLQEQLVSALNDKQRLEKALEDANRQLSQQQRPQEVLRNAGATGVQAHSLPTVNVFTPDAAKSAGIPTITTIPNVVSGIVRERTGNLLVGILVTVKDKEDIPVRALKTNKLGQFAASTPLAHGTYTLEVEDPKGQFFFDQARVILNGNVLPPIEIIAKTQQELDRKKLEHAVFGQQNS